MADHHHFLVVTAAPQSHINPSRNLARRLARTTLSRVTIAVPIFAHRLMFPSSTTDLVDDGPLTYAPYSDGMDDGRMNIADGDLPRVKLAITQSLTKLAGDLAAAGRPVTCIIFALILPMAADVASSLGVPSALFWIQPATVFAIYYRYFHGFSDLIDAHANEPSFTLELPGLPPFGVQDLPSFLTMKSSGHDPYSFISDLLKELFEKLDRSARPRVLVNTFGELEAGALASLAGEVETLAVGPMTGSEDRQINGGRDLFEHDDAKKYLEWLDGKEERSVVYASFGSLSTLTGRQSEEIAGGLEGCGRPYLWVVRRGGEEGKGQLVEAERGEVGMVVGWCDQVKVLSHRSIGCFVTHCGWNSALEGMACGVPMVMVPQWTDQVSNARMVEGEWGMGVRGRGNGEAVVEGEELRRCLDLVMGEGDRGVEIRRRVEAWRGKARAAAEEGGSADRNLKAFVESFAHIGTGILLRPSLTN